MGVIQGLIGGPRRPRAAQVSPTMVPWLGPSTEVASPSYWPPSPAQYLQTLLCFKVLLWAAAAAPLLRPPSLCSPAWAFQGLAVLNAVTERQAVQPRIHVYGWGGAKGIPGVPVPAAATAPPLPAAGEAVQWLLVWHALKLHREVGDGRQPAGGRRGAGRHLVSIVSLVSGGGGAHPIFADDTGRQCTTVAAAQQVLLGRGFDQISPAVVQRNGQNVELVAAHSSLQAVLGCRGGDAGKCCILPVLYLLQADVILLVQEGTDRDGVAELFGFTCNQGRLITKTHWKLLTIIRVQYYHITRQSRKWCSSAKCIFYFISHKRLYLITNPAMPSTT